jgi:uncharacterized YigZ family protein
LKLKKRYFKVLTKKDTYKTSKFFGYAFPVLSEDDVKNHLSELKKMHHAARHWCYAYQLGTESIIYRANDDGEPNNSAGMPIYGQIQSFGVTNILIVVVRYFGGVKLGVGGLINAYKTSAQLALENSKIITKTINIDYLITFEYKNMNKVMRIIKEKNLTIRNQKLELNCQISISVREKDSDSVFKTFKNMFEVSIKTV